MDFSLFCFFVENPKITDMNFFKMNLLALLLIGAFTMTAQIKDWDEYEVIPMFEMMNVAQHLSIDMENASYKGTPLDTYNDTGEKIGTKEFVGVLMNGDKAFDLYRKKGDEKIVAIRHRELNAMEKAMMKEQQEMMKNSSVGEGKKFPAFEFKDLDGNSLSSANLQGKILVVNAWFIKCKPCIMEMPEFNTLVEKYKSHPDVVFLGITFDSQEKVKEFIKNQGFDYTLIPGQQTLLTQTLQISSFPTNIVVDREGNIAFSMAGYSPDSIHGIEATLQKLVEN